MEAATVNLQRGLLDKVKVVANASAAPRIAETGLKEALPLSAWQTGAGTQSNMNVNEVIAALAGQAGVRVHPND